MNLLSLLILLSPCGLPPMPAADAVIARFGEAQLTLQQLEESMSDELCNLRREQAKATAELYQQGLRNLIDQRLLEAEAKRRGLTGIEALLEAEKAHPAPTPDEVKAFYEMHKGQMEGASFEEAAGFITQHLDQQKMVEKLQGFVQGLGVAAKVEILLEPYRVPMPKLEGGWGPADAPITIVEFADYECPYCVRAHPALNAVKTRYPGKIRVVFRDFPLSFHQKARPASIAARCAGQQGHFWRLHERFFSGESDLSPADIEATLKGIKGFDMDKFAACQADPAIDAAIDADMALGQSLGVSGTPAFFINGVPLSGAQPAQAFFDIIDAELKRAALAQK
ncbi:thioredoxin domain-containing protein [Myxococcota bacterium]|nr:thioredoxin domain-containing protein [Myxococcota bacterium]MBU1899909.1 thioredoxin domain-containing protein [Myxococcota bacterium]